MSPASNPLRRLTEALIPAPRLTVVTDTGRGSGKSGAAAGKPTIVMLHGIVSSSKHWHNLTPLLTPSFRCVAIDLLGFGDSPKPPRSNYSIDDHVRSLRATLRRLDLDGQIILMGHSLGSLIATRYAADYPEDVSRLVLLSPPIYLPPSQLSDPTDRGLTNIYLGAYRFLREHKDFTLANAQIVLRLLDLEGAYSLTEATWIPFVRSLERCIESQTFMTDIARVQAPTDLFYGGLDPLLFKDNLTLIGAFRQVTLRAIPTADHILRKGYAEAVAKELTR
jgi:pimeloyl-ACP methyl ester carboxylesterase